MSNFKMIGKLGLLVWDQDGATGWVKAEELEQILQSAQVVYGHIKQGEPNYWGPKENGQFADTHTALIVGITPIKKKNKAEAALELLEKLAKDHDQLIQPEWHVKEAKRILEMKD